MEFIQYMIQNKEQILSLVTEHIELTAIAVGCSILVGVPLGILISYVKNLNKPVTWSRKCSTGDPEHGAFGIVHSSVGNRYPAGCCDGHYLFPASDHKEYIYRY